MQQFFYFLGNVKTFPYLVGGLKQYFWEYCIPEKEFHPKILPPSPWEFNIPMEKKCLPL